MMINTKMVRPSIAQSFFCCMKPKVIPKEYHQYWYLPSAKVCTYQLHYTPGLYMIGYGTRKIILKFPLFCRLNEEYQERKNSKHEMKTKNKNVFVFT